MTENEYTPIYQLQQSVEQWLRRNYDSPFHVTALTVIKAYKQQAQDWPSLAAALPHHKIGDVYQAVNNLLDIKKQEAVYKKPVQPELLIKHLAAQGIDEDTAAMANWETWRFANEEYKRVLSQYQALKHRIAGLAFTQKRLWSEGETMD